ncbi:hypothetical protein GCM10023238_38490 [Streptomyces heliomycini]
MSSTELPSVPPANVLPKVAPVRIAEGERLGSVELPGITLSVRSRPPAREGLPSALYIHGLGGSSLNWSALMPLLDDVVDSEAVDLPGFGDSPPPDDGDYSVTAHARVVIRYLDATGRGPVHLFGNSLGGAVRDPCRRRTPDLVRTLTLVSPALPELRVQRTAVPTGLLAVPGVATAVHPDHPRVDGGTARPGRDAALLRRSRAGVAGRVPQRRAGDGARLRLPYFWDAMARSARGIVSAYLLGRPARTVAPGRAGARADPARLRRPGPARRLPHGPAVGARLPEPPAGDDSGRGARRDDGVPRDGGPRLP